MTMMAGSRLAGSGLAAFSPQARKAIIRAGMTAADCGQRRLGDAFLLLALAEGEPLARPVELGELLEAESA